MSDFEKLIYASDLIEWIMETNPDWCVGAVRSIVDHVEDMPSAQQEYEPVIAEDFAKIMTENTLYQYMVWYGVFLTLMKEQGFVICKKTM